jgi:hypothetical protein
MDSQQNKSHIIAILQMQQQQAQVCEIHFEVQCIESVKGTTTSQGRGGGSFSLGGGGR